jgi:hypothetical protein
MPPVTLPTLRAPPGARSSGVGSCWGGNGGSMESSLQTTMPADSILAHYSAQLVAAGWKLDGRPAFTDGMGVQRFSFREGPDDWAGALIIIPVGDRRDVVLRFTKVQ